MAETTGAHELIRAAVEAATSGVAALRAAGMAAAVAGFVVEIDYAGGDGHRAEVGAVVRLDIVAADGAACREPGDPGLRLAPASAGG